jgi:mannitol-1-phosphate 5-dehydrogenase
MTTKSFVGFGFGPIQSALMLFEAARSGNFGRLVVAEVAQPVVDLLRASGGVYTINVATAAGLRREVVEGVEIFNPAVPADREQLVAALATADEAATALPSVDFFDRGDTSVARLLADSLAVRRHPDPLLLYAAENNNEAANILTDCVARHVAQPRIMGRLDAIDTVIGKMSGTITEAGIIDRLGLAPMTPDADRAILVEEFNRILIATPRTPGLEHSIPAFVMKRHLGPFEEAKLFGHNAIHALLGYLAEWRGLDVMSQLSAHPDLMAIAREAFIEESGAALVRRHASVVDELFTPAGMRAYAEDLLVRMVNPYLYDQVERVGRDPRRKLSMGDRLYGAIDMALAAGIRPRRLALGAAAGLASLIRRGEATALGIGPAAFATLAPEQLFQLLADIWGTREFSARQHEMMEYTWQAIGELRRLAR